MLPPFLRAIFRLPALLVHILTGVWIVYVRFPRLSLAQRRARVQQWAAAAVLKCGITLQVRGQPAGSAPGQGVLRVCNHISWLDIPALHAVQFCRFVSKSEVRYWPVIGRLATAAETLYLQRSSRRDAHRVLHDMADRLRAGDALAVFPEGTTSNGLELLPFHANLLQAAISADAPIQPVALQFLDAQGQPSLAPCYINNDTLLASLWRTLRSQGLVAQLTFGDVQYAHGRSRQQWAADLRADVQALRAASGPADVDAKQAMA